MINEFRYGDDRTIHRTGYVDVEVDQNGQVVAVWFRCHPIPFRQSKAHADRAVDMRQMYAAPMPAVKAIVFEEEQPINLHIE